MAKIIETVTFTPVKSSDKETVDLSSDKAKETASRQAEELAKRIQYIEKIGVGLTGKAANNIHNALLDDYEGRKESKITVSIKDKPLLEVEVTPKNIDKLTTVLKKATKNAYEFNSDIFHDTIHKERNIHAYTPEIEMKAKKVAREKFAETLNSELGNLKPNANTGAVKPGTKKSF